MIESAAPVRICDNGGWTDTWFGGPGRVLNMAVRPGVQIAMRRSPGPGQVLLNIDSFGDRYSIVPGVRRIPRHALVEAAVDSLPPPGDCTTEISIRSDVPAGCGTGTSAAVAVALLGALTHLRSGPVRPGQIVYAAHRLEVDVLGSESGIQDHLSAAYGGINYIEVDDYPEANVVALPVWEDLTHLLSLVYLGRPHNSTSVHRQVIETLQQKNGVLSLFRGAAITAREAVIAQDLLALGHSMISNTEAQRALHPAIVGTDAERVIRAASDHRAVGWKVNGAGGDGGSLTILSATTEARAALEAQVEQLDPRYRLLRVEISRAGLRVNDSPGA